MSMEDWPIRELAVQAMLDWKSWRDFPAKPYLMAMSHLDKLTDKFGVEDGEEIVLRFLVNCQAWKGEKAREVKKELRARVKKHQKERR